MEPGSFTPFEDLNQVLLELVDRQQAALGSKLIGMYLQGSFAAGGFDEHSDLDWLAVLRESLTIERSWAARPFPEVTVRQPADPRDLQRTLEFVRYCLKMAA